LLLLLLLLRLHLLHFLRQQFAGAHMAFLAHASAALVLL
jgi:hypothetical protein